ncbi:ABC transporter ATP-binding protein [candidate division WWE3 bacterium CG22_combo_CG10-13_8_21_14_all_39_12]|uniref:ABC transporter ATP-binding protein n=2 Tax=Katanobacteria TaxID=422282 RepID=A0A2M7X1I6_UNCKA|nr:MAG: ABC transporter ATP-binding protein [candidate division WWE3 bacterium CG22_combo_CG10-13_8_21_14_all_39_12]PJA39851.1 MAG: ABC transporter ATP-binding protein [candidate division WWE3 bacterium CG_4_9_14_3_um_filter_39_7]
MRYNYHVESVIHVKNLVKSFGKTPVVKDLSFDVNKGDVFAFLGANGSGKTTTIRCLLDILQPTRGSALIFGNKFDLALASRIGYLPEERGLYTNAQVMETLVYFAQLKGMTTADAKQKALKYLDRVELSAHHATEIKKLSSGQQQKIQLGITLINAPDLLILDEPTKGLDPVNRSLLMELLDELNENGATIVFVSHQMDEVEKIANRLVMIKNGSQALYGSLQEVKKQFGTNTIHITYQGEIPSNDAMYRSSSIENNVAELTPTSETSTNDVISHLIQHNVIINDFTIGTPSLQDVFVKVMKSEQY